jgi:hypothetical protein
MMPLPLDPKARRKAERAQARKEREIRRARRIAKRKERELKKAAREARKERHARILEGPPIAVIPAEPCFSDLRGYYPLQFCEICREIKRANYMHSDDVCADCHSAGRRKPRLKIPADTAQGPLFADLEKEN